MQKHRKVGKMNRIAHFCIGRRIRRLFIAKFLAKGLSLSFVYIIMLNAFNPAGVILIGC